jgi:ankyrin repeat protein
MSLASDDSNMSDFVDYSFNKVHHEGSYYSWETPTMPQVFVRDLYARMMETPDNMDPDMLFAMFLVATAWPKLLETSRNGGLDILLLAAVRGLMAARGVVDCVVKHYGVDLQDEVEAHLPEWRGTAVISGSLLAQRELESHDREVFSQCRKQFHDNGGYATLYGSFETTTKIESTSRGASHSRLHELVTFRTPAAIEAYLQDESDADIDEITSEGETAIYLACARGSWEIFQILLSHGANCRIPCTQWVITCLHWVFAFDEDRQADVVSWLIHNGADPDALTNDATPFPHFPFVLPPGTALHWAVATGSHTMIKLLIQQGFNVLVRDGCDMYVYDERIRILDKFGGPNMEAYSIPRGEVRGLSALDYAAIARDPFIFELIMEQGISIHINDVDEEGLSVLHRLSTDPMRRTRTGNVFADTVFRGEPSKRNENLLRTVQAIVNLGGDLELLTTPSTIISEHNRTELTLPSYTPLMMATLGTSVELVEALLRSGAKVDAVNDKGQTALLCVSEDREAAAMIVPALLSHGENVNHIDNSGSSPIFLAAGPRTLEIVKLLLCKGADIDSRSPNREDEHAQGRSIFSMLPREDEAFNDEADLTIKEMLEKHVFNCPDTIKKQRVIGQEDINGRTLLHHFARSNMPHCVQALLSNNSPVNSVEYIYRRDRDGDAVLKVSWNETPLDSEFVVRERKIKEMQRESVHTLEENEDILSKIDRVIMLLQNAGGTSERSDVKREPFTFDETKYGKRGFVRALREFGVRKQVIDHPQ